MPFITDDRASALNESTVRIGTLAEFRFRSDTKYLWNGPNTIRVDSIDWEGLGGMGEIDNLPSLRGTDADLVTVRLSGVDPSLAGMAANSRDDVQGRPAYLWFQLFDIDWQPVGARIPAWWGIMQRLTIERGAGDDESGGNLVLGLEIESVFAARAKTGAGRYTDSEQRYRWPGDKFCAFVGNQVEKSLVWPNY